MYKQTVYVLFYVLYFLFNAVYLGDEIEANNYGTSAGFVYNTFIKVFGLYCARRLVEIFRIHKCFASFCGTL